MHWLAVSHKLPKNVAHIAVQLHWIPNVHRRRDPINLMGTQKALVDALAAGTTKNPGYGLVADDTPQFVTDLMPIIHSPETAPRVRMWVELDITQEPA
jgi:crossover junction endodeoxyribonuclease RusA